MGPACIGGVIVIILTIPMTGRISSSLKTTQKGTFLIAELYIAIIDDEYLTELTFWA
jgi:hypothetical protein